MNYTANFFQAAAQICEKIDDEAIETLASELPLSRQRDGRLFIIGVRGSAANSSHAVNDFRKLCGIQAYAPTDNVAELTARTDDEGWDTVFSEWIKVSRGNQNDPVLVFSVGGGDAERNVSPNIVRALDEAKAGGMRVFGMVGRDGGYTKKVGDVVIVVPTIENPLITSLTEAFQGVVWHGLVSHPALQIQTTKWEGLERP